MKERSAIASERQAKSKGAFLLVLRLPWKGVGFLTSNAPDLKWIFLPVSNDPVK